MTHIEAQRKWIFSDAGKEYLKSESYKESVRKHNRKRDRTHRDETQRKVRAIKLEKGCLHCGFDKHYAALDFHHRNPETKKFRLSESRNYSWKMVEEEMFKCDVLCRNCHSILEHDLRVKKSQIINVE